MTFEEALNNNYGIVVMNDNIARKLQKEYKRSNFASVNCRLGRLDGYRGIYADESLKGYAEDQLKIYGAEIVYGKVPLLR